MDYQKIDAALVASLDNVQDQEERAFSVFIHTTYPLGPSETAFLERLGISGVTEGKQVYTAMLSAHTVGELSDQPWVQSLRLSRKLRLLDDSK